jgi:hypothetical protein
MTSINQTIGINDNMIQQKCELAANKYLLEHFYDKKMKEFFELRLGRMTMAEYEKKFLGFLKYARFIGDEKVKIQRFLSGLPTFYKENINYDEPNTLTEAIKKAKYIHEQGQGSESLEKYWKDKKNVNSAQRRKGLKPPFNRNEPNRNQQY